MKKNDTLLIRVKFHWVQFGDRAFDQNWSGASALRGLDLSGADLSSVTANEVHNFGDRPFGAGCVVVVKFRRANANYFATNNAKLTNFQKKLKITNFTLQTRGHLIH